MFGTEHPLKLFIVQEIWVLCFMDYVGIRIHVQCSEIWVLCIMLGLGYMISVWNRTSIEALHRAGNLGIMFYGLCWD